MSLKMSHSLESKFAVKTLHTLERGAKFSKVMQIKTTDILDFLCFQHYLYSLQIMIYFIDVDCAYHTGCLKFILIYQ